MRGWLLGVFVITAGCIIHASGCMRVVTDYRLVTKTTPNSGIIEALIPEYGWGVICNTTSKLPNTYLGTTVCKHLNYPGLSSVLFALDFNDNRDEWPSSVIDDAQLFTCDRDTDTSQIGCKNATTSEDCRDDMILAVTCREPGFVGCFSYGYRSRRLAFYTGAVHNSTNKNSPAYCVRRCKEIGFSYAGLHSRYICSCMVRVGDAYKGPQLPDEMCSSQDCPGDPRETCGSTDAIAIYDVDLGFCEDPRTPAKGFRSGDWFRWGSVVNFTCSEGIRLIGAESIQCIRSASGGPHDVKWSATIPSCCGSLIDHLLYSTAISPATTISPTTRPRSTTTTTSGVAKAARVLNAERLVHGLITTVLLLFSIVVTVVLVKYRRSYRALLQLNSQPTGKAAADVTCTGLQAGGRSPTEGEYSYMQGDAKYLSDSALYESLNDGVIVTVKQGPAVKPVTAATDGIYEN